MGSKKQLKKHRMCHAMLWFVSAAMFFSSANGKETVVIVAVPEGDKVVTADGDTLQLANVQAVSINDPDSLRRALALKARAFLEKQVLNRAVFVESAWDSSPKLGYLWRKKRSLATVNSLLLKTGYAYFNPEPEGRQAAICRNDALEAKRYYLGVHRLDIKTSYKPVSKTSSAFWWSVGGGYGSSWHDHFDLSKEYAKLETAMHYRLHSWLFNVGGSIGIGSGDNFRTGYLAFGRSSFNRFYEVSFSVGPGVSQRIYYPEYFGNPEPFENRPKKILYDPVPALVIQAQVLAHFFDAGPAVGISLDGNYNREWSYWILSLNLALGAWNF